MRPALVWGFTMPPHFQGIVAMTARAAPARSDRELDCRPGTVLYARNAAPGPLLPSRTLGTPARLRLLRWIAGARSSRAVTALHCS